MRNWSMSAPPCVLAVLFVDISGSTRLYESLGDDIASRRVARCIALLVEITRQHRGNVVRVIGDEVLSTFDEPDAAVDAAHLMHETLADRGMIETVPLAVRIGIHHGPVLVDGAEIYGDTVNVAARVVAQAKPEQILTSRQVVAGLRAQHRARARYVDRTNLRGKLGELDLYEIIWRDEEVTRPERIPFPAAASRAWLTLRCQGCEVTIDHEHPHATIGRGRGSDVVVDDSVVSRLHARVEYAHGRFLLEDQSTNGTYLRTGNGGEAYLRRDQMQLMGSGLISLGRRIGAQSSSPVIRFEVRRDS
jgi:class 3 adenylate cyclase